jgi:hypothetical protein
MADSGVPNLDVTDAGAYRGHMSRAVATRRAGIAGIRAKDIEHVTEVEAYRAHMQLDLALGRRGRVITLSYDAQAANGTARVEVQLDRPPERLWRGR